MRTGGSLDGAINITRRLPGIMAVVGIASGAGPARTPQEWARRILDTGALGDGATGSSQRPRLAAALRDQTRAAMCATELGLTRLMVEAFAIDPAPPRGHPGALSLTPH